MTGQKLDHLNVRILEELQCNARITNQELAEKVGLSPSACLVRVRKLETDGVISRYLADVDIDQLDHVIEAFIEVNLVNHERGELTKFENAMGANPHVVSCHRVSGQFDYLLLVVAQDMQQLREIADGLLSSGHGVSKISTIPILAKIKPFSGYPFRHVLHGED